VLPFSRSPGSSQKEKTPEPPRCPSLGGSGTTPPRRRRDNLTPLPHMVKSTLNKISKPHSGGPHNRHHRYSPPKKMVPFSPQEQQGSPNWHAVPGARQAASGPAEGSGGSPKAASDNEGRGGHTPKVAAGIAERLWSIWGCHLGCCPAALRRTGLAGWRRNDQRPLLAATVRHCQPYERRHLQPNEWRCDGHTAAVAVVASLQSLQAMHCNAGQVGWLQRCNAATMPLSRPAEPAQ
jgi:hypothetical protein